MPTQSVGPEADEHLRDVANALLKARKVIVVTGAGISTNSGIPDFRSENGLYSLIQAQFDAASRQAHPEDPVASSSNASSADANDDFSELHSAKRRKSSDVDSKGGNGTVAIKTDQSNGEGPTEVKLMPSSVLGSPAAAAHSPEAKTAKSGLAVETSFNTPRSMEIGLSVASGPSTSPLSSPPTENFRRRTKRESLPFSSSPLSSPPSILFDPFTRLPSSTVGRCESSTSPSEIDEDDDNERSNGDMPFEMFACSQGSAGGRNTLPNMKGKDLFDANIWSDPIRTSVFYTFATSLRQKIKSAEPTTSHRFISHLRDRGKLVRCYTQNIDLIEEKAGLSTRLQDGPGSRSRFSRRSTANTSQLSTMVEEGDIGLSEQPAFDASSLTDSPELSQISQDLTSHGSNEVSEKITESEVSNAGTTKPSQRSRKKQLPRSGVECVFLHGSLALLRCFLCGQLCSWDEDDRAAETLSGQQPECPHCVGATIAREERGKRALGVGKLRPDIVLYGEEHPNSHLISPIITHDLALVPDMLLILGTSLRVHGLKVMVREFAKAVHSKGGKVVFVNFTKPSESTWGDIIDYWVQWDCDAWVNDLQSRIPRLWLDPEPAKPKIKRESSKSSEKSVREEKKRPPAANPVALRDTKVTGAYWTSKVLKELHRITCPLEIGVEEAPARGPARRLSMSIIIPCSKAVGPASDAADGNHQRLAKTKTKRARKSAPGALEKTHDKLSTAKTKRARSVKDENGPAGAATPKSQIEIKAGSGTAKPSPATFTLDGASSILSSVKVNPRVRKRKVIDGEEVPAPFVGRRRGGKAATKVNKDELKLPPIQPPTMAQPASPCDKLQPMEPRSKAIGPLSLLSPNLRSSGIFQKTNAFYIEDPIVRLFGEAPSWSHGASDLEQTTLCQHEAEEEARVALTLTVMRNGSPTRKTEPRRPGLGSLASQLMRWGATWDYGKG